MNMKSYFVIEKHVIHFLKNRKNTWSVESNKKETHFWATVLAGEESLHPQLFYCNPQNWIVSFLIEIQFPTQIIRLFTMYIVNLLLKVNWISLLCILPTQDDICPLQLLLRRGCSRKLFIKIERVFRSLGPVQIKAGLRMVCVKQWSSSLMSTNWQENDFGRTIAIITLRGKKNKCSKDRTDWFYIYKESSISTYWVISLVSLFIKHLLLLVQKEFSQVQANIILLDIKFM